MVKLYKLFVERDATLVEINPISEISNGKGAFASAATRAFRSSRGGRQGGLGVHSRVHGLQDQPGRQRRL